MLWVSVVSAGVLLALGLLVYFVSVYNTIVGMSNSVARSFSNIDAILKQRWDEIPNLVAVSKGYMAHERGVLEDITRLRSSYPEHGTTDAKVGIENDLSRALHRLQVLVEAYPDLKANQNLLQLQYRLSEIESNIADRRELFNDNVTRYNAYVEQFPPLLIARAFGYRERPLLLIAGGERAVPAISLDANRGQ